MKRLFLLISLAAASAAALAQPITAEDKADVLKAVEDIVLHRAFVPGVDFARWPEFVEKRKDDIEKSETNQAFASTVNRALSEFGLTHIRLQTPRAAAARNRTSTVGVGLSVQKVDEGLRVRAVSEFGPAKNSGISAGDVITLISGKAPTGPEDLEGDEGTKVDLKVKKSDGNLADVTLERKKYSTVRPETLKWQGEDTAVLRVYTFSGGYDAANVEKLMTEAAKAKYLVLDLRSNGGGATNNLNHLLSLLLPDRTVIGTFVNRHMAERFTEDTRKEAKDPVEIATWSTSKTRTRQRSVAPFTGKLAVLVNQGSASASEITAAALRENAGAVLVGSKTAGAVLASIFNPLPHGFSLQYPVSDYVTSKGMRLEKHPLIPDAELVGDEEALVAKAIELLKAK